MYVNADVHVCNLTECVQRIGVQWMMHSIWVSPQCSRHTWTTVHPIESSCIFLYTCNVTPILWIIWIYTVSTLPTVWKHVNNFKFSCKTFSFLKMISHPSWFPFFFAVNRFSCTTIWNTSQLQTQRQQKKKVHMHVIYLQTILLRMNELNNLNMNVKKQKNPHSKDSIYMKGQCTYPLTHCSIYVTLPTQSTKWDFLGAYVDKWRNQTTHEMILYKIREISIPIHQILALLTMGHCKLF